MLVRVGGCVRVTWIAELYALIVVGRGRCDEEIVVVVVVCF